MATGGSFAGAAGGSSSITSVDSIAANVGLVSTLGGASSTSATQLSEQVQNFLHQVQPSLGNNEYLKLIIAAMIMQYLMNDGQGMQASGERMTNLLEGLSGNRNSALFISMESSTNVVQIEHASTRLDMASAVQTLSETSADTGQQPPQDLGSAFDELG
jgi:hypothetical protein